MSANSAGLAISFKAESLEAIHNLASGGDTIKAALYLVGSSITPSTTAYTSSGEVSGTNYSAGGVTVTNATSPTTSGSTAYWTPSANIVFSNVTLSSSFDCCLIYNASKSNKAIGVITFAPQTIAGSNVTITMPSNGPTSALLQFT